MLEPIREPALVRLLHDFAEGSERTSTLSWADRLEAADRARLRADLRVVLAEPTITGEPLDLGEVVDILHEYAALIGWSGSLLPLSEPTAPAGPYEVVVRPPDLKALARAAPAVQESARELLERFLPAHPTAFDRVPRGHLKKMADREIWQLQLPDGYRLRYLVDEVERKVHVVRLGPHRDGDLRGREKATRASIRRGRAGCGPPAARSTASSTGGVS
jgi:mRNA-degrading endonuclease RelE of RelBE toxin-antitoxin system